MYLGKKFIKLRNLVNSINEQRILFFVTNIHCAERNRLGIACDSFLFYTWRQKFSNTRKQNKCNPFPCTCHSTSIIINILLVLCHLSFLPFNSSFCWTVLKQAQITYHFKGLKHHCVPLTFKGFILFYFLNNINLWSVFRISSLACRTESAGESLKSGIQVSMAYSTWDPVMNWSLDISQWEVMSVGDPLSSGAESVDLSHPPICSSPFRSRSDCCRHPGSCFPFDRKRSIILWITVAH